MLAYLCLKPAGSTRTELAETFWGFGKLASVRQALYELRKLPGAGTWLSDSGDVVSVDAETDVDVFDQAMSRGDTAAALVAYGGALLEGEFGFAAPPFQDWLAASRDRLSALHLEALVRESERLEALGQVEEARLLVHAAVEIDQFNEGLYRSGMRLAYAVGDTAEALRLHQRCATLLGRELGTAPEDETRRLAQAIERGEPIDRPLRPDLLPQERLRLLQATQMGEGALGVSGTAQVLGLADLEVADGLAALQQGNWLDANLSVPARHSQAVEASITPAYKRLLHERIAAVLSAATDADDAVVARHLLAASEPRAAAPRFVAAAMTSIDKAELDEATSYLFQAGWAAYDLPEQRLAAYALLEGIASQRGDEALQEAALAAAEDLADRLQDDAKLVDVKLRRSRRRLAQGQVGEGLEVALEALEIANRLASGVLLARARNAVGAAHYFAGDLDGAAEAFAGNLEAADLIERYRAYNNLASLAAMRGASEVAYSQFEAALTLARSIGPKADVAATLNNLAATADRMGEYPKAVRHFREGIAVSRRNQAVDREGRMLTNLAAVYARQGQLGPSWNTAEEVEELAETISAPRLKLAAIELKADVQRLCGMLDLARTSLGTALDIAEDLEDERKALTLTAQLKTVEALAGGELLSAEAAIAALDTERLTDNAPWLWFDLALAATDAALAIRFVRKVSIEGRLAHHRMVADIAIVRASLLSGADEVCLRLASEAAERLAATLDPAEIVERPLGRLVLALSATLRGATPPDSRAPARSSVQAGQTQEALEAATAELGEQGAGLPRVMRENLLLQPGTWLATLTG